MADWTSGYVVDIDYTHGFYQELTPSYLSFLSLLQGVDAPGLKAGSLAYCELGCGQGFSTNLLAAANPHIEFYATDFNPSHIAGARDLARTAGLSNVHFFDDSFAEFNERNDLPDFDLITLHGIYSWISPENRQHIVQFIRRRLKPGGLVYLSYNTMPGWAAMMPLRRLFVEHAEAQGSGSRAARIKASLSFTERLGALDSRYFAAHPQLAERLKGLSSKNPDYIAHEYFNRDFHAFYFMDVARELAEAKLTWVGPANTLECIDEINLSKDQREFLTAIDNTDLRQTVRDHIVNQQFRRDIFIKGPVKLAKAQEKALWMETRFSLSRPNSDISRSISGMKYSAKLPPELYDPLIERLEREPCTVSEMMEEKALARHGFERIRRSLIHLAGQGACHPSLPTQDEARRQRQADLFNTAIARHTQYQHTFSSFASSVTGGGIAVDWISQLIWLGRRNDEKDLPRFIWDCLAQSGRRLLKEGKPLITEDEGLAEIGSRIANFESKTAPILASLGIKAPPSSARREKLIAPASSSPSS